MSAKPQQKRVSLLSKVFSTNSATRLEQKKFRSSRSSSQMINLAEARDMLYYSGKTSGTSLIAYKGPKIKTIEDWLTADEKTRETFAYAMDIIGPIEAARAAKNRNVGPSNRQSKCPICNGLGYVKKGSRNTGYMHPSELSSCDISLLHSWLGDPYGRLSEPSPDLQGRFDMGTVAHMLYQWYAYDTFENTKVNFNAEVSFKPSKTTKILDINGNSRTEWPPISGHADGSVEGKDFKFILEIKTIKQITDVTSISKNYLVQQMCYARMLNAPGVLFVFLEKADPGRSEQVFCGYSKELWDSIENKMISIIDPFIKEGRWPEKTVSASACKNCSYGLTCEFSPLYKG